MLNRHFLRSDYLHIFFYIKFLVFVSLLHQIPIYTFSAPDVFRWSLVCTVDL